MKLLPTMSILVMTVVGGVLAFFPFAPSIPERSELRSASGALTQIDYRPKKGMTFWINGHDKGFHYLSHGNICGSVQSRVAPSIGQKISIEYLPMSSPDPLSGGVSFPVYGIEIDGSPVCSYWEISEMINRDFKGLTFIGYLVLFFAFTITLKAVFVPSQGQRSNSKDWQELSRDLELEKGEKIIGDQWEIPFKQTDNSTRLNG